jgi:hypothetical protein
MKLMKLPHGLAHPVLASQTRHAKRIMDVEAFLKVPTTWLVVCFLLLLLRLSVLYFFDLPSSLFLPPSVSLQK